MRSQYWFVLLVFGVYCQVQVSQRQGVLQLTAETLDSAIKGNKYLFIDVYAPWCQPCMQFEPEFYQMGRILNSTPKNQIVLGSYDATKDADKTIHDRFKISSYPTFIFFIDGVPFHYDGQRSSESMMTWMRSTIDAPPPTELRSIEEINEFISANDLAVLYFGNGNVFQDKNFWTFFQVSKLADEGAYGYTLNDILIKKAGYTPNTLLAFNNLKDVDQIRKQFNQAFTRDNVQKFIIQQTLPDIPSINDVSDKLIFQSNTPAFLLFTNYENDSVKAEKNFIEIAQPFKKTYQFAISKITDEFFFTTLEKLGLDDRNFPQIVAVQPKSLYKYRYDGNDFSGNAIKKFIFDFRQGKVERFIKSQPIPTTQEGFVKKIVGLTFEEEVMKSKKDMILEFYTSWCKPCKEFKPTYELLAYRLSNNQNIVVAQINAGENEYFNFGVSQYPEIMFIKANDKTKRPTIFNKNLNRTITELIEFARNETTFEWQQTIEVS